MIPGFACQELENDYLCLFRSCEELHEYSILICPHQSTWNLWKFPWHGRLLEFGIWDRLWPPKNDPCRRQGRHAGRTSVTSSYFFPEIPAKFRSYVNFVFCSSLETFYSLFGASICSTWGACQSMGEQGSDSREMNRQIMEPTSRVSLMQSLRREIQACAIIRHHPHRDGRRAALPLVYDYDASSRLPPNN